MSINQITVANTFGQLITAVAAMIAVANNLTDGPQVHSNSSWTFTNPGVGINVGNTAIISTANVGLLNVSQANVTNETIGWSNISTANVTTANIVNETVTALFATRSNTANANVIQLECTVANVFSANIQTANIGTVAITSLSVASLTVPVLNASFANITSLSVTGTSQHLAIVATLVTTDNCNVRILNTSSANISNLTAATLNTSSANITTATIGTLNMTSSVTTGANIGVANISFANITTETIGTSNISTANITNLFANVANIVSCNITSANVIRMNVAANPTANLEVSTKAYTDIASNAFQALYSAKGDILAANQAANAVKLAAGTNGQSLIVDTTQVSGLRYASRGVSQTFRGLSLGTSMADKVANGTQVVIYRADEIVMNDGEVVSGWTLPAVVDITASGVGGLDTGSVLANTCYEIHAIRKRTDGTKGFMFHRAPDRKPDQNTANLLPWPVSSYLSLGANSTVALANMKLAQGFTPNTSGPVTSIEIRGFKTSTPTGNIWLTLEANTAGFPSGTPLATSRKYDVSRAFVTNHYPIRFAFDTTANVTAATAYYWVLNNDYAASATAFMNLEYSTFASNTTVGVNPGGTAGNNNVTWARLDPGVNTFIYKVFIEANSAALTFPAGYDQSSLISYAITDPTSKIREYKQRDRQINVPYSWQWMSFQSLQATTCEVADFSTCLPPITVEVSLYIATSGAGYGALVGTLEAIDLPVVTSLTDQFRGAIAYVGTTPAAGSQYTGPQTPFWMEHQACNIHLYTGTAKWYVAGFTF